MPKAFLGIRFDIHAATGVRMIPPMRMGITMFHIKDSKPMIIPNTKVTVKDMNGSVVSTVPTAFQCVGLDNVLFSLYKS